MVPGRHGRALFSMRGLKCSPHPVDRTEYAGSPIERKPCVKGPDEPGAFATRSPTRPNPIAVSSVDVAYVDEEGAVVGLYYIDAYPGSLVLDLKTLHPKRRPRGEPENAGLVQPLAEVLR